MDLQNFLSDLHIRVATSSFGNLIIQDLQGLFDSPAWVNLMFILRATGLLATMVLIYLVIFVVIKANIIGRKLLPLKIVLNRLSQTKDTGLAVRLKVIKQRIERKSPDEDRRAVLEASQLLERGLARVGQKNPLFRENVENVPYWSSVTPDKIFAAYNIRTKLLHNPGERVSHEEAEEAVGVFEKALQDLGVI